MNKTSIRRSAPHLRAPLLRSCALALVLAVAGQAQLARATGFQGTGTVVPGSGSASIVSGANSDTITIDTAEVVIDWVPNDVGTTGTIDFLPNGNSVLFVDNSSAGLTNYTVLNRILPEDSSGIPVTGRPVAFNGTVQSQLGAANFPVGNVWFYSPGGIIAGPTAVFNVGALVLTASTIDTTSGFGSSGTISFTGTPNSLSSVTIQPGAQINVVNPGSYVALVAPRVVQAGTVEVNGSVAYVGAEAANITINGGLFDISIGTGTDDTNGVVHAGTTNLTPDTGTQRAFVAAVPKNNALTMLLTGTFGYSAAASAAFQDSAVILSAGHDIVSGQSIATPNGSTTQTADISIGNSNFGVIHSFGTAVEGRASGSITVNPTGGGTIQFDDSAAFKAGISTTVGADDGESITASNGLDLHAGRDGTGGTATLYANGATGSLNPGQIGVTGSLFISSDGFGPDAVAAGGNGQDGTGGTTRLLIDGGRVIADSISLSADGFGGNGFNGGNGTGGDVLLSVADGQLGIAGSLSITADGYGGAEEVDGTSGDGLGGTVLIELLPGLANSAAIVTDSLSASASGYGVPIPGDYFANGNGGLGQGGSVRFDLLGGALGVTTDMALGATGLGGQAAAAFSGPAYTAGDGFGGQATFNLDGGFADVPSLSIFSTGQGGYAQAPSSIGLMGVAGNGTAGTSQFIASSGTMTVGDLFVHAYGVGGATEDVFDGDATNGGDGFGGSAEFTFGNANLDVTALELFANGDGGLGGSGLSSVSTGAAGSGGNGTGGTATMTLGPGNLTLTGFAIEANGTGGAGGGNQGTGDGGSGGDGFGGSAILDGTDAEYGFAAVTLEAMGIGGPSGTAVIGVSGIVGSGTGGLARVSNADTAGSTVGRTMDSLTLNVGATGTSILSGRAEISDTASFAGGGLVITGDLNVLGDGPEASLSSGFYYSGAGVGTSIGGNATIAVGGVSEFDLDGSGVFGVTGALQISGGRNITVRHTNQSATPTPSILAGTIDFSNFGFISGEAGSLISSIGAMNLASGLGYIDVDRLDSGGSTVLDAANGTITVATDLQSAGAVQASGQSIDIRSLDTLTVTQATASAGDINLFADNGLSLATGTASGAITLGSTLGDIAVTDLTGATISISTFGTANFAGLADAQSLQVNSGDIVIGAGAQLGVAGTTTLITLANARTANPTFIGGADSGTGYSLSAAELTRLFSDSIEIIGTFGGTAGPDVVVDSFTMTSRAGTPGGNLGANGSLSIVSAGNMQIIGDVALTGLGAGNQLFFTAEGATTGVGAIEVDAANASISLTDANGALAGQVNFEADEVFIATPQAIADVRAESSLLAMGLRLGENDGIVRNGGVVRAATIFADVGGGLYIQNVGATADAADRRGFAALTDTLDIATGSSATRIVVNGQLVDAASGTVLNGLDVLPLVRINGVVGATSGNFDPSSTVNGCVIASPRACTATIDIPGIPPPYDTIDQPLDPEGSTSGPNLFPTIIVELKEFEPFGYPPLIDEPVTGAGNDDLWMPACEEDETGCPTE
jgi:filamentous hemagglutinin family protein